MFRKDLIEQLTDNPMSVTEIAREAGVPLAEARDDLEHIAKSLRHGDRELFVIPARCRKCDFTFGPEKLTKPSKCPKCRSRWIYEPRVEVRTP